MARLNSRSGFTVIEILVVVVVVGLVGALGYSFFGRLNQQTAKETSQTRVASDVPSAPEIKRTSDLDEAEAVLDQADPGSSSDLSQLDSAVTGF